MDKVKTKIYLRRDTLTNWLKANPVLGSGEVAVVFNPEAGSDINHKIRIKVGDGLKTFKQLSYISDYDQKIAEIEAEISDIAEVDEEEETLVFKNHN